MSDITTPEDVLGEVLMRAVPIITTDGGMIGNCAAADAEVEKIVAELRRDVGDELIIRSFEELLKLRVRYRATQDYYRRTG
ncbi:hypothetical protein GW943_00120 [Candidatus Parcubacteria bacterium]|uniref:Uncharacterized protein n=1 Tax=Candidatus Kaiserbacteria bacterium CG10_big_fil_rev_8_21_14_0_10_47_16 TaxID=1974608 RepID=A0A2H0UER1_9BACT|nr:hypothetical protein [Candidatus Parcubacteria bacterium]PIR84255.1 MAG: hypothetical protein COU16_01495 [Candidatus Kaiserbacteria bacterium CG10_big_fil_rev_8_21_14_0_10_47_16]